MYIQIMHHQFKRKWTHPLFIVLNALKVIVFAQELVLLKLYSELLSLKRVAMAKTPLVEKESPCLVCMVNPNSASASISYSELSALFSLISAINARTLSLSNYWNLSFMIKILLDITTKINNLYPEDIAHKLFL